MSVTITPCEGSPLTNIISGIEERQCDLIDRRRNLRDKITTMERSIPALMAYNMWMTEQDCPDTPYQKVREIMSKFSPHPDPADKLVAELRSTVNELRQETAQLHDKIVDTDVKLEETDMELESLELANKEMEEKLMGLRDDVKRRTLSLHSIHSEDLICLKKIRQLAEEELKLKNCIKQLESKEIMYRRQMSKLLPCKKYRCVRNKDAREPCCPAHVHKCDLPGEMKEKYPFNKGRANRKKMKTRCSCAMPTAFNCEDTSKKFKAYAKSLHSCDSRTPRLCCGICGEVSLSTLEFESACSMNIPCESLFSSASETGVVQSIEQSPVCTLGKTCKDCKSTIACKQINKYRYGYDENCVCTCELSIATSRDCNVVPPTYTSKKTCQSPPAMKLESEADDSNSDDEFCECCPCGNAENL